MPSAAPGSLGHVLPFALAATLAACGGGAASSTSSSGAGGTGAGGAGMGGAGIPPNILLVIADDMGVDQSVCHAVGQSQGKMPRIQEICARGVVFDEAWSAPTCSPTRATILTGRYGFHTGVGTQIVDNNSAVLGLDEQTLPKALEAALPGVYAAACIGKWHLSSTKNGGANHPNTAGFSHYAGMWQGQLQDYFSWPRTVDGVTATISEYATTVQVNDARDWIAAQGRPWFVWLAFNAPHAPFHTPPAGLHSYPELIGVPPPMHPIDHYHAMLEAMDTELGRLLDGLGQEVLDRTWIIFVGDNGTPRSVVEDPVPASHAKDSVYQGGIHVPLVIAGPGVIGGGRKVGALVHTADLFATILDLAGADPAKAVPAGVTIDAQSLAPYLWSPDQAPLRPWAFSELFGSTTMVSQNGKAIRDESFKLIRFDDGHVELYDLRVDPEEAQDLAAGSMTQEAATHASSLASHLDALLATP